MFRVGGFPCKGNDLFPGTTAGTTLEPGTASALEVEQNTPHLSGVCLSTQQLTPVYIDGFNGWQSPSGIIPKAGQIALIDTNGNIRSVDAKRVSLIPTQANINAPF